MLPVVAIVGRSNVGKSTLFNALTNTRNALVIDFPGTTRDRNYGFSLIDGQKYIIIDTAGIDNKIDHDINKDNLIINQVNKAIITADLILFVVDAAAGLMPEDLDLAKKLRKFSKKVMLVINKIDGVNSNLILDFFRVGFKNVAEISATTNRGIKVLLEKINNYYHSIVPENQETNSEVNNKTSFISRDKQEDPYINHIKVAIIGQPNVGKSTLINSILGEERVVVSRIPGTTRDSIYIPTIINKQQYLIIDTAGVRRKSKVKEKIEKFSVIKTMESIEKSQVVVLLVDASKGLVEQDLKLINFIISAGRSLVIAVNKLDLIAKNDKKILLKKMKEELAFINFINLTPIIGIYGTGIKNLFTEILKSFKSAYLSVTTNRLTLLLQEAISENQLPIAKGRRIKLRYAHLGGYLPFRIIIHGTQTERLPDHYKKYLSNFFRTRLKLYGTLVQIILKNSDNPYV